MTTPVPESIEFSLNSMNWHRIFQPMKELPVLLPLVTLKVFIMCISIKIIKILPWMDLLVYTATILQHFLNTEYVNIWLLHNHPITDTTSLPMWSSSFSCTVAASLPWPDRVAGLWAVLPGAAARLTCTAGEISFRFCHWCSGGSLQHHYWFSSVCSVQTKPLASQGCCQSMFF